MAQLDGFRKTERIDPFVFDPAAYGYKERTRAEIATILDSRYLGRDIRIVAVNGREDLSPFCRFPGEGRDFRIGEPTSYWLDVYVRNI